MIVNEELKKLILFHYRRSHIGEVEPDTIEFRAILEKNEKRVKVGQYFFEGTNHKPRDIFKLLKQGWKLIAVESCYKWCWNARRYISDWEANMKSNEDCYGRPFKEVTYSGWYTKIDVFEDSIYKRYSSKLYYCDDTGEEKVKFNNIPNSITQLLDETEYLEEKQNGKNKC